MVLFLNYGETGPTVANQPTSLLSTTTTTSGATSITSIIDPGATALIGTFATQTNIVSNTEIPDGIYGLYVYCGTTDINNVSLYYTLSIGNSSTVNAPFATSNEKKITSIDASTSYVIPAVGKYTTVNPTTDSVLLKLIARNKSVSSTANITVEYEYLNGTGGYSYLESSLTPKGATGATGATGYTGFTGWTGPTGTFQPLGTNYGDYVYWNSNTNEWAVGTSQISLGSGALKNNTTGSYNVALGNSALNGNTSGIDNTAIGTNTLINNTTGSNNTAIGNNALKNNKNGTYNSALGFGADVDSSANTWNYSTAVGYNSQITASNQIVLGTINETVYIPGNLNVSGNLTLGYNYNNLSLFFYANDSATLNSFQLPTPTSSSPYYYNVQSNLKSITSNYSY